MLPRDTDWRQGDLLTCEAAVALGLVATADERRHVIVITHDCDLRHDSESHIEIIVADLVPTPDPQLSYAKNPRRLHLAYQNSDALPLILELRHGDRRSVSKGDFAKCARDSSFTLPVEEKRTLKQWLAARYGRPAFPEAFETRLRNGKIERKVVKILESNAKHLVGLFFDLGEQRGVEVVEEEPYALSVSVVYDVTEGGSEAKQSAERVAGQLRDLFEKTYGKPNVATGIALDACEAVADTRLTLADLRRVDQWRLEYISLRDGDSDNFLPVGELPG